MYTDIDNCLNHLIWSPLGSSLFLKLEVTFNRTHFDHLKTLSEIIRLKRGEVSRIYKLLSSDYRAVVGNKYCELVCCAEHG